MLVATYCLLITFANTLDSDQDRQNFGSDLDPICLTCQSWSGSNLFAKAWKMTQHARVQKWILNPTNGFVGSWLHDRCDFNFKFCMNIGSSCSAKKNQCFIKAIHMLSITCFESFSIDIPTLSIVLGLACRSSRQNFKVFIPRKHNSLYIPPQT